MKMITAIVNKKDADEVCHALTEDGYFFTKMATTGGFLTSGNVTLIMGVDDEKVKPAMDIIRKHCSRRVVTVPASAQPAMPIALPVQVTVGGATVFVTSVDEFEKM